MRTLQKARADHLCGRCVSHILRYEPMEVIQITGLSSQLIRCMACAVEAFDPTKIVERRAPTIATPSPSWTAVREMTQTVDFKRRQSGEREPGEDG